MINEELVGGLKSALERGYSLEKAMLTLFNSGYKREEIEEAARNLLEFRPEIQIQSPIKTMPKGTEIKPVSPVLTTPAKAKSVQELRAQIMPMPPTQLQKPIQKVSNYEKSDETSRETAVIVVLVFLLIFLVGLLGGILVFRQQLIDFLNSLFA